MRILSMTATFGKLEGQTLRLEPGLNVIAAPNEWGKSTWCAFLLAMLYGVDTRQRARQGSLPDKERYRPWSGKPMEGSMDILWQGRAVTIQRRTRGRIPMGEFRAFETDTGLPVGELTAANCGETLLGVERSVYSRCGFLRGTDLAVTPDEALSRRLNQLVTTGDDSPEAARLEEKLRELRNKCQYNKTGALPQARQELARCRGALERHRLLGENAARLEEETVRLEARLEALRTHARALEARENREKLKKVEEAREQEREAARALEEARARCQELPAWEETERKLREYDRLQEEIRALELEAAMCLPEPPEEQAPEAFRGLTGPEALARAQADLEAARRPRGKAWLPVGIAALGVGLVLGLILPGAWKAVALGAGLPGIAFLVVGLVRRPAAGEGLMARYGIGEPEKILTMARAYGAALEERQTREEERQERLRALGARRNALTHAQTVLGTNRRELEDILETWAQWADARRALPGARRHREALEAVTADLTVQELPDGLTLSPEETRYALGKTEAQLEKTRSERDKTLGERRAMEDRETLEARCEELTARVEELERWHTALGCALELLGQAKEELRSRFAPRIAGQARELLEELTLGSYDRLLLEPDFSLSAAARGEDTVVSAAWRSDGTADQMYLALRLAVLRALAPEAPLVLDDALNRFDGERLKAAMNLLRREERQILLFTCQTERMAAWEEPRRDC
ncbi:MAG: AAA family ATPase [Firmicutes bacterium]|nr:AAA family ATPase [Bacillota bacterium]